MTATPPTSTAARNQGGAPSLGKRMELAPRPELEQLQAMGVVGMGGAGFPAHAKYRFAVDTVVANGAECEPLLWSDKHLLLERADEVVAGLARAVDLAGARRGIVGVKAKYHDVMEALAGALAARGASGPELVLRGVENFYPAGDEVTLVYELTGRVIPEAGLPLDVGVVVNNVATLGAMHRALSAGEPVTSRLVTVAGEVARPSVLEVPIGTPFESLVAAAGGLRRPDVVFLDGGPMMGVVTDDATTPVAKTTSGVVVLPADHPLVLRKREEARAKLRVAQAVCCLCAECTEVCPRNALGHRIWPHRLMQAVATGLTADTGAYLGALLCCECGLCTHFGCPMHLDPCQMNIEIKARLRRDGVAFSGGRSSEPIPFHDVKKVPTERLTARLGLGPYTGHPARVAVPLEPERVRLPLSQGASRPARPVVRPGQAVRAGQVVAEPDGALSVALHASIAGQVEAVTEEHVVLRRKS